MTLSLHQITVPVYDQMLTNLDFVLERERNSPRRKGSPRANFWNAASRPTCSP